MNKVTVEPMTRIWLECGDHLEVCEDGDGLDMVEIRYIAEGKIHSRMSFSREAAPHVSSAILRHLRDVKELNGR